jgi:uncharacterized protein YdaU (DUF1376 family)
MHYYQFNIGDYASHTRHLSLLEDLAYRRILELYYLHERPLIDCSTTVARLIGMSEHHDAVDTVLTEFFEHVDGLYVNTRVDKEIAHYHSKIEQASRAGKASAERRSNVRSTDVQPTNNQEPITINQESKKKATSVACPQGVGEEVWQDWLQLRKAKKAPVTQTVINSATKEAEKAGISLNAFLTIWCARGSQGLQAEWLKPNERQPMVNRFDVANVTTPPPPNQDAALRKIEADRKNAVPPSLETLAKLAELRKSVA